MEKKVKKVSAALTVSTCLCLLFGLTACLDGEEQTEGNYQTVDANQDAQVDTHEFSSLINFDDWDDNNDGNVDHEEFYDYHYGIFDEDDDGIVNENEWKKSSSRFMINPDTDQYGDWKGWDVNSDNRLDKKEFSDGLGERSYRESWDKDRNQQLDEQELKDGLFNTWDKNRNGHLEEEEYNEGYSGHFAT